MSHSSTMIHTLSLCAVSKKFDTRSSASFILKNISYTFKQGVTYALTGRSGAGKSTLLHIVAGLECPTSGQVLYNGACVHSLRAVERQQFLHTQVGYVFQQPYLIAELTVLENVMIKQWIASGPLGIDTTAAQEIVRAVGLAEKQNAFPPTLSGGEQYRVAVARALVGRPSFFIADEPTGNLDAQTSADIIELLLAYQKKYTMGLIISTHDERVIQAMHERLSLECSA